MRTLRTGLAALALGLTMAIALLVSPAAAAGCGPVSTVVDARLLPTGSMEVVEHSTFDFGSGCHGGTRDIPPSADPLATDSVGQPSYLVSELTVTEGGQPVPIAAHAPGSVRWGRADVTVSGRHTYDVAYTVTAAVVVGDDAAVLYWQFADTIPEQRPFVVHVTTPEGSFLDAWAHGVATGIVQQLSGSTVDFTVPDNPANGKVEVRLLMAATAFAGAHVTPGPLRQHVLDAETSYAGAAERARAEKRAEAAHRRALGRFALAVALAGAVGMVVLVLTVGRDPKGVVEPGMADEVDDLGPPAVAMTLLGRGSVPDAVVGATLVDLAQRGHLVIADEPPDVRFTAAESSDRSPMAVFEHLLLDRVFHQRSTITQAALVAEAKASPTDAAAWRTSFLAAVKQAHDAEGYRDRSDPWRWWVAAALVLAPFAVDVWAVFHPSALAVVALIVTLCTFVGAVGVGKTTQKGADRLARLAALKEVLEARSAGPVDERRLVWSVALGVAAAKVDPVPALAAAVTDDRRTSSTGSALGWFQSGHLSSNGDGFASLGRLGTIAGGVSSEVRHAFVPPPPPPSSSSSSSASGSFSGGGGGGGGGGSSGGW